MLGSAIPCGLFLASLRLRYQLLWAQGHSVAGKAMLSIALYVLGVMVFFLFALGGLSATYAAMQLGRRTQIASWILAGLMVARMAGALLFGAGPRPSF